jgi:carboxymethylenebutenolidase
MCHSGNELPLVRKVEGSAPDDGNLMLRSADGTTFAAYFASAKHRSGNGIVVAPDAGGLSEFYRAVASRLAEAGIDALTIDYYGRTAGSGPRPAGFNGDDHMARTRPDAVDADVAAAADYLRSGPGGAVERVFCMGFCFGGAVAWRQARNGMNGGIGFYGSGAALRETVPDLSELKAPLLLLVAGRDKYFPLDDSMLTDQALEAAGVSHRTVVYDEATHGFFSDPAQIVACDDAWSQVMDFVKQSSAV